MNAVEFMNQLQETCKKGFLEGLVEGKMDHMQAIGAAEIAFGVFKQNVNAHLAGVVAAQKPKLFVPSIIEPGK